MVDIKYRKVIVGGFVRDKILGIKSKDLDYSIIIENRDDFNSPKEALDSFESYLENRGFTICQKNERTFTVTAKNPETNAVDDFVLARKESGYREGTREPDSISLGTLRDDLERRDFIQNCLCIDPETDEIIDLFGGLDAIHNKILSCPISAEVSFNDDPLRILRGFRFAVTKDFILGEDVINGIRAFKTERFVETISGERIREELFKMFSHDTIKSLELLNDLKDYNLSLYNYIFGGSGIWLTPTSKKRKKNPND